jgi:CotH kinase protein/Lamin Tail Domain
MRRIPLRVLIVAVLAGTGCSKSDPSPVRISEIMYHPVLELESDEHEFIELENPGDAPADLSGHQLAGGIRFIFPAGAAIPARGFLVVARRRERLLEVGYDLDPARVIGDYGGALSNEGDTVRLERVRGSDVEVIDEVTYDDDFPWPLAADALGAGETWLTEDKRPRRRFMGRSLERRSAALPGNDVANWSASALDGATPGRPPENGGGGRVPTVTAIETSVGGRTGAVLAPGSAITVRVAITPAEVNAAALEYFVDDLEREDETPTRVELVRDSEKLAARLPGFPAGSLVRLRVRADAGAGDAIISPRPEDPNPFHSFYVTTPPGGRTPVHELLIAKRHWSQLWDNIVDGRVPENISGGNPSNCLLNPRWDARVPAVLIADGAVWDIQARYQGSRVNRWAGPRAFDPMLWPPSEKLPSHVQMPLSWHFNFPRYARFEGKRSFNLNKLTDAACQGFLTRVGNTLFEEAGIPAAQASYVRLYINGRYYHYMQRLEHVDEELLVRHFGPQHDVGDLFKSVGARWDEGPYGFGDESLLGPHCGFSKDERYDYTYKRQTFEDERPGSAEVRVMLEALHAARDKDIPALRDFFMTHFDLDALTNYMVVRNWLGALDDVWQNHYLYRKADGRWMVLPTDLDNHFGFSLPSAVDASFFSGVANGRSNWRDLPNYLKDSFLRAFREEFVARVRTLSGTVLHPSNVLAVIDEAAADYVVDEAKAAPAGLSASSQCGQGDPGPVVQRMKAFVRARHERVLDGLFD